MLKKFLSTCLTVGLMLGVAGATASAAESSSPASYRLSGTPTLYAVQGGGKTTGYVVFRTTDPLPQSGSCVGSDACLVETEVHGLSGRARHAIGSHCYRAALMGPSKIALRAGHQYRVSFRLRPSASSPLHTVATRKLTAHGLSTGGRTPALSCSGSKSQNGSQSSKHESLAQKALVGKRVHLSSELVVKEKPGLLYRGLLTKGTSIKIAKLSDSGRYAYGYAYGHVQKHAWVRTRDLLKAADDSASAH